MLVLLALACTKIPADDSASAGGPAVTLEAAVSGALDSVPSPNASLIYFVDGARLAVIEGGAVTEVAAVDGATGLVTDDGTMYVADGVEVQAVNLADGTMSPVAGTESTGALAVELSGRLLVGGVEDGAGAVWSVADGAPTTLVNGLPSPITGVVGGTDGTVYAAGGDTVYAVSGGVATPIATGVLLGEPAGIALTPDDAALMVSSLSAAGTAQVLIINLADYSTSIFDDVIGANHASGGLHRAKDAPTVYAWIDRTAGVHRVEF